VGVIFTTVRLERPEGTVLLRGIAVAIQQATAEEHHDLEGARPYDAFLMLTMQGVPSTPIQRRDVLFDEQNNDPETGQLAKYRVSGLVESFLADHQEIVAERVVGG
jgi:hypothetical protein